MKVQGWDDGRFYQRLVVPNAVRLDEEDLFEAACWLLLNRWPAHRPRRGHAGLDFLRHGAKCAGRIEGAQPRMAQP